MRLRAVHEGPGAKACTGRGSLTRIVTGGGLRRRIREIVSAIEVVVFDLDDTLYPECAYALSGFAAVAKAFEAELGDPAESLARMKALFETGDRGRVFNGLLAELGKPEDVPLIERMIAAYRSHRPTIACHPDADAALQRLRGDFKLGLITDGPATQQSAKIDALRLAPRLDHVVLTAELGPERGKPHPAAFEAVAAHFGVPHEACCYVADNAAKDFVAPVALGWLSVQVVRPDGVYRDKPAPPGGEARHRIDTLDRLDSLLT